MAVEPIEIAAPPRTRAQNSFKIRKTSPFPFPSNYSYTKQKPSSMISEKFEASIFTISIEEMASWELGGLDIIDGFVRV